MKPHILDRHKLINDLCIDHPLYWSAKGRLSEDHSVDRGIYDWGALLLAKMTARKIRRSFATSTGVVFARNHQWEGVPFEGALELAFYVLADFDWLVQGVSAQPFEIEYAGPDGKSYSYFPDALVHFSKEIPEGKRLRPLLVEVKKQASIDEEGELHDRQTNAGKAFAAGEGYEYKIFTEKELLTPYWKNAKFLRRFCVFGADSKKAGEGDRALLSVLGDVKDHRELAIGELLEQAAKSLCEARTARADLELKILELQPHLYRMLCTGFLAAEMTKLLNEKSKVWIRRPRLDRRYSLFL